MGIAEAQCTSADWYRSHQYAIDALIEVNQTIRSLEQRVSNLHFDREYFDTAFSSVERASSRSASYNHVSELRRSYRDTILTDIS